MSKNLIGDKEQLQLIVADTAIVRAREENKTVNKMITLLNIWLNSARKNINFSKTLQKALKEELNI